MYTSNSQARSPTVLCVYLRIFHLFQGATTDSRKELREETLRRIQVYPRAFQKKRRGYCMHCSPTGVFFRGTAQDGCYINNAVCRPAGRPGPSRDANMASWLLSPGLGNAYFMSCRAGGLPVRTTASDPCWPARAQGQNWDFLGTIETPNYYKLCDLEQQTSKIFVISLLLLLLLFRAHYVAQPSCLRFIHASWNHRLTSPDLRPTSTN